MSHNSVPEEPDEDAKPKQAPLFVSKPEPVTVEEGEWARFCARVTGHPRPRVMWLINGHTVVNVCLLALIRKSQQQNHCFFFYRDQDISSRMMACII